MNSAIGLNLLMLSFLILGKTVGHLHIHYPLFTRNMAHAWNVKLEMQNIC